MSGWCGSSPSESISWAPLISMDSTPSCDCRYGKTQNRNRYALSKAQDVFRWTPFSLPSPPEVLLRRGDVLRVPGGIWVGGW